MDKGGEMANNHKVQQIFAEHGCVIQPATAAGTIALAVGGLMIQRRTTFEKVKTDQ